MRSARLQGCRRRRIVVPIPVILGREDMTNSRFDHRAQYVRPSVRPSDDGLWVLADHRQPPSSRWPRVLVALGVAIMLGAFLAAWIIVMIGIGRANHPAPPMFVTPSRHAQPTVDQW